MTLGIEPPLMRFVFGIERQQNRRPPLRIAGIEVDRGTELCGDHHHGRLLIRPDVRRFKQLTEGSDEAPLDGSAPVGIRLRRCSVGLDAVAELAQQFVWVRR